MGPSSWGFGQAAGNFGQCGQSMTPMYALHNAQQQVAGPWSTSGMKHANTSQTAFNPPAALLAFDPGQHTTIQESRQMQWGPPAPQPPAMTNVMADIGAPGPFQSAFNMFLSRNLSSDQGYVMGGANQHPDPPQVELVEKGMCLIPRCTHAERAARIKEMLQSDSGRFQAMSGQVLILQRLLKTKIRCPKMKALNKRICLLAMSTRCQMWLLHHIKSADVLPLCSKGRQDYTRQFIAFAGSIFDERIQQGERVDTPDMLVNETTVDGKGQCFIYSRRQDAEDKTHPKIVRTGFLNYVLDNRLRKTETIGLCDVECTMKIEYPTLDLNDRKSIQAFSNPYVKGDFQSGFAEMLYFALHDQCVLENVTPTGTYAKCGQLVPIGYIPCYDHTGEAGPLKLLKA